MFCNCYTYVVINEKVIVHGWTDGLRTKGYRISSKMGSVYPRCEKALSPLVRKLWPRLKFVHASHAA